MAGVLLLIDFGNDYWIYWSLNLQTHYVLYVLSLPLAASRRFLENFEYKRTRWTRTVPNSQNAKILGIRFFRFPLLRKNPEKPKSKHPSFGVPRLAQAPALLEGFGKFSLGNVPIAFQQIGTMFQQLLTKELQSFLFAKT